MHGQTSRSSYPEVFLGKCIQKTYSKLTREHPCRSAMLINLQGNFIEITLWHGCSPVNLLPICRTSFPKKGYFCIIGVNSTSYLSTIELH